MFVRGPPDHVERIPPSERVECTSSKLAPAIDTVVAGYQVYRTIAAMSAKDSVYTGAPISREADIGFGVGLAALFGAAAIYGYSVTGSCAEAKEMHRRAAESSEPEPLPSRSKPPVMYAPPAPARPAPAPPSSSAAPAPAPSPSTPASPPADRWGGRL